MRRSRIGVLVVTSLVTGAGVTVGVAAPSWATAGTTTRVSVSSVGVQSTDPSASQSLPTMSPDGRFVLFHSYAPDLWPGAGVEVALRDRTSGTTEVVSLTDTGEPVAGNVDAEFDLSADGRYVVFRTATSGVLAEESPFECPSGRRIVNCQSIYLRDRVAGTTTLVSRSTTGEYASGNSGQPRISADGRYVVFASGAPDLVPGDTNGQPDIFVRDILAGTTQRVSVSTGGEQGDGVSLDPAISADGRFVAFSSMSTNIAADPGPNADIFVHDLQTGTTEPLGYTGATGAITADSFEPSLSADGSKVVFMSYDNHLVAGDTNPGYDLFVQDRTTGATSLLDVDAQGVPGANSDRGEISDDGRWALFRSPASLVTGVPSGTEHIYVRNLSTGTTTLEGVDSGGNQVGGVDSGFGSLSGDGRFVAFWSRDAFTPDDTNGTDDVFVHDRGAPARTVSGTPAAGGTVTTDAGGDGATLASPLEVAVTTPQDAAVSVTTTPVTTPPFGWAVLGGQVDITANPPATAAAPYRFTFDLDVSVAPPGSDLSTLGVFRNGAALSPCADSTGSATPDPCLASVARLPDGDVRLTALTSHASTWLVARRTAPVDTTAPVITISSPADGATLVRDSAVTAAYGCSDAESGVATCAGPVPSGAVLSTATVGTKTFTVTASDVAGNGTTRTSTYRVVHPFTGFTSLGSPPILNTVKAGFAVPVRFGLGGNEGLGVVTSATSTPVTCPGGARTMAVDDTTNESTSSLSYKSKTQTYTYTWPTSKTWVGTCRSFVLTLDDGTSHTALFQLTRSA